MQTFPLARVLLLLSAVVCLSKLAAGANDDRIPVVKARLRTLSHAMRRHERLPTRIRSLEAVPDAAGDAEPTPDADDALDGEARVDGGPGTYPAPHEVSGTTLDPHEVPTSSEPGETTGTAPPETTFEK